MTDLVRWYITHEDEHGERHQLRGWYDAVSEDDALTQMFAQSNEADDGKWRAFRVMSDRDIID